MEVILRVISSVLSVYMLLLFIRILLTWFSGASLGRPQELLVRVTDPYLNIFRRISFLRTTRVDFSPIAAVISLVIVTNIVNTLRAYGHITIGIILALIVSALWSAVFFILGFFMILTGVRFISILSGRTSFNPFWQTIDMLVNPTLAFIQRVVFRGRQFSYRTGLALGVIVLGLTAVLGRLLVNVLTGLLQRLPF
jgi:YggT family protein